MTRKTYAIVGLGLLGGSYAKGLYDAGYEVIGIARRQETIDYALAHNYITQGSTNAADVAKADVVILCLYPKLMLSWIHENKQYFKKGAIVSDIAGVKRNLVLPIQEALEDTDAQFISTHPMAGKEVSGIEHADPAIFHKANFIIVPTKQNSESAIQAMMDVADILQFQHISLLSIDEHDRMIGFLSQLTHVIAVSLMNTHDNDKLVDYTGDSFRDLTRIAKINEDMWTELFLFNKDILLEEIEAFEASLDAFKLALQNDDEQAMKNLFIQSTNRRKKFDKKPGKS